VELGSEASKGTGNAVRPAAGDALDDDPLAAIAEMAEKAVVVPSPPPRDVGVADAPDHYTSSTFAGDGVHAYEFET
jgi:hypothetical protein